MGSGRRIRGDAELIRACEIANQDPALREVEEEFGALQDEIEEPWEGAPEWEDR